jgi:signal transduction histidine kinase
MSIARDEATDRLLFVLQKALGHELPNRLIAIQGFAQLLGLEESDRFGLDGKEYLQRLSAATQRAATLVKGLAELVRSVRATEVAERFSLSEAWREAAAEVKQLASEAIIEYDCEEAGPYVQLSRAAVRQVAAHLLRNACQAAAPQRPLRLMIGTRETANAIAFWVSDNGRGFPSGQLEKLFEPFAGRDASATGAGLGLILVRQIIESWGGTLEVQSQSDQGTTITVTLPKGGV